MANAEAIARVYLSRGRALHGRGNFDAAGAVLRVGQSIQTLPEAAEAEVQAPGARPGLLRARRSRPRRGVPGRPRRALGRRPAPAPASSGVAPASLTTRATTAARTLVDHARALDTSAPALIATHRRLLLGENPAIAIVLALFVPALVLTGVIVWRRRASAARMLALADALDRQ